MACAVGRVAWHEAARLGYSAIGASPGPRRIDPWIPPEEPRSSPFAAFLRGLRGVLMGVRGTSRRRGA